MPLGIAAVLLAVGAGGAFWVWRRRPAKPGRTLSGLLLLAAAAAAGYLLAGSLLLGGIK